MVGVEFSNPFEEVDPCLEEMEVAFIVFDVNRAGFIDAIKSCRVSVCNLGGFGEALKLEA